MENGCPLSVTVLGFSQVICLENYKIWITIPFNLQMTEIKKKKIKSIISYNSRKMKKVYI